MYESHAAFLSHTRASISVGPLGNTRYFLRNYSNGGKGLCGAYPMHLDMVHECWCAESADALQMSPMQACESSGFWVNAGGAEGAVICRCALGTSKLVKQPTGATLTHPGTMLWARRYSTWPTLTASVLQPVTSPTGAPCSPVGFHSLRVASNRARARHFPVSHVMTQVRSLPPEQKQGSGWTGPSMMINM